jgi:glutathione S-transferase
MSELKVYGYILSQPVRSVLAYLKFSDIDYTFVRTLALLGENLTEEYQKINPFQAIPAILHGDYNLWESAAIVTYISEVYDKDNSWYPKDLRVRGRINAYLHWHHQAVRDPCMAYIGAKITGPKFFGQPEITEEQEIPIKERFNQMLADLKWALGETRYVARTSGPTIADVFAYNELTIVVALKFFSLDDHPEIKSWYDEIGAVPLLKEFTEECSKILATF